uniref:Uncharacterized protein n=2 Tax=Mus TaxID=862507 RepID=Q3UDH3_MOUSE|nr:unnamed protein product [Mus musculus]
MDCFVILAPIFTVLLSFWVCLSFERDFILIICVAYFAFICSYFRLISLFIHSKFYCSNTHSI